MWTVESEKFLWPCFFGGGMQVMMAEDTVNELFSETHPGKEYVPPQFEIADHYRARHLRPERDWERMDIWVPKSANPEDRLPCIKFAGV